MHRITNGSLRIAAVQFQRYGTPWFFPSALPRNDMAARTIKRLLEDLVS